MTCVYVIAMSCERFYGRMTVISNCSRKFVLVSICIFTLLVTTTSILKWHKLGHSARDKQTCIYFYF